MDREIVFLLPNEAVCYYTGRILEKRGINLPVCEAFMEESILQTKQMIDRGAKVIITRGSTADILREAFSIPIVEIRYSFYEFAVAMQQAITLGRRVALVGYNEAFRMPELADIFPVEQLEIRVTEPQKTQETLEELRDLGIEVVISGHKIAKTARKLGLQSVTILISEKNILDAVTDARHLCDREVEKQRQFSGIASLLEHAQEGLISIDKSGHIIEQNLIAKRILSTNNVAGTGSIYDYVPQRYIKQILEGLPLYNEVVALNHDSILLSGVATYTDGRENTGAVLTLQPADDIHKKEYELRRKSAEKGHTAKNTFEQIIGNSRALREAKAQAGFFAVTESNILIYGPTGTGKELFAQSIHNASRRSRKPFVAINCAALPESVLESELFGYVKGAFTGARPEGKMGIFEQAHTGTIFLDEVSEVSPTVQARLLRVIQEREITRVGDDKIIPVDVRIIASTNRNLLTEIREKRFREDLFYRLSVLNLSIPPLCRRKEDIPLLTDYFLNYFCGIMNKRVVISPSAMEPLCEKSWPGNIRQLRNTMECAVAICQSGIIDRSLVERVLQMASPAEGEEETRLSVETVCAQEQVAAGRRGEQEERERLLSVLRECGGNKTRAAAVLGIGYTTLWRKLKKYGER